jgi:hypothetical protein
MTIKAYAWDDESVSESYIVWAETVGKAKALLAAEHDEKFTDIRTYRLPWADKYRDMDDIPAEEFLAHGWWLPCAKCGTDLYQDTAVLTDTKVLCKECAGKDGEEK